MTQRFGWFFAAISIGFLAGCADGSGLDKLWPNQPPQQQSAARAAIPAPASTSEPAMYAPPLPVATGGQQRVVKVALLLPLSGDAAGVGKALRDAAVMALFDKYATMQNPDVKVELLTHDTAGTAQGARQAATQAVKEGARLIIGPLFSHGVEAIKPLAKTGKITIISFSNRKEIAGDGVYAFGFDPAEQARRIADYAYRRDISNVAALVPNDAYGREVTGAFEQIAKLLGRKLEPVVRYAPAGGALERDIRTLASEGTQGARFTFSALLLPEAGGKLATILDGLKAANISSRTIQFIGTGLWDDQSIIRQHDLAGAWLASSPPEIYAGFEQRYQATYGQKPPRLASLSYDAVALATTLAASEQGFSRTALESPAGFYGPANGIFRLSAQGTTERGLAVLEVVGNQGFKVIDPAPTRFR